MGRVKEMEDINQMMNLIGHGQYSHKAYPYDGADNGKRQMCQKFAKYPEKTPFGRRLTVMMRAKRV